MKDLISKLLDKLPVKWTIIFASVGIIGYFTLQFYKEHHNYEIQMAQVEHATQSKGIILKSETQSKGIAVTRIEPKQDKQIARGIE